MIAFIVGTLIGKMITGSWGWALLIGVGASIAFSDSDPKDPTDPYSSGRF